MKTMEEHKAEMEQRDPEVVEMASGPTDEQVQLGALGVMTSVAQLQQHVIMMDKQLGGDEHLQAAILNLRHAYSNVMGHAVARLKGV